MIEDPVALATSVASRIRGLEVVELREVVGGYTKALRWRAFFADGSSAFVKTAPTEHEGQQLRREAAVYSSVDAEFLPRFYGWDESAAVLVIEDLSNALWTPPFPDRGTGIFESLEKLADVEPPASLGPYMNRRFYEGNPAWQIVKGDPVPFLDLGLCQPRWFERSVDALIDSERQVDYSGDNLVHGEVGVGNLCYSNRGVLLVDWGYASRANRWLDVAGAIVEVRIQTGETPDLYCDGAASWAAANSGAMAHQAPQPIPSTLRPDPGLREAQKVILRHSLEWAVETIPLDPMY